ncbi:hypothetical protein E5676_scaffold14G00910 [Cucumis melo var. makuwa]|uniref:Uncharacterized protein n=1 Tax=Cucumis melo var. makuwa TaxID=1194695 RepID=A0A5D3DRM1_CUCMM|nr:hypothetical protein E6C27_scaffold38G001260 [Cucumis melo var. makuwa]TYK26311.1 hypothetical protein E5676_scaffold14G00910 [Cucumis melo var. makuwa]
MLCSEAILVRITFPCCTISRIRVMDKFMFGTTSKSCRNFLTQTTSFVASQAATYSTSIVESAMHHCLMLHHTTALPFRVNTDPDVDFLESLLVWTSESVYPIRIKSLAPYTSM